MPAFLQVNSLPCNLHIIYFMFLCEAFLVWTVCSLPPVILLGTPQLPYQPVYLQKRQININPGQSSFRG